MFTPISRIVLIRSLVADRLPLALLAFRLDADDADHTLAPDDLALPAHSLD
jgi:hypothetical protein